MPPVAWDVSIKAMNANGEYRVQCLLVPLPDADDTNAAIWRQYLAIKDDPALSRTHYFNGRYENLYVPRERMPALELVLDQACRAAGRFLEREDESLSVGFWLNDMGPGHVTLPHRHDEDDELVSGVYYVRVPEASGELVLTKGNVTTVVKPQAGMFVFFDPDVVHEVTENKSRDTRLSIGMNFGVRR